MTSGIVITAAPTALTRSGCTMIATASGRDLVSEFIANIITHDDLGRRHIRVKSMQTLRALARTA